MIPNIEEVKDVIVGRYYMVPTAIVPTLPKQIQIVPVIGPAHEDAEFINFPHRHYHPDRRFVPDAWFSFYERTGPPARHWAVVYSFKVRNFLDGSERDTGTFEGARVRLKCKRLVDTFRDDAPWLMKLEQAYCNDKLRDGHICPHRGISCAGVKSENDGVVCPGHGLKWDMQTGHLVSRIGQTFQQRLM